MMIAEEDAISDTVSDDTMSDGEATRDGSSSDDVESETASVEMVSLEEGTCRICLDQARTADLIEACHCTGSRQWVHRACIDRWRSQFSRWHVQRHRCQVCRRDYRYPVEGFRIVVRDDLSDPDEDDVGLAIRRRQRLVNQRRRVLRHRQRSQALVIAVTGFGVLFVFSTLVVVVVASFPRGFIDDYLWAGSCVQGSSAILTASLYFHVTVAMERFDAMHVCILVLWAGGIFLFANHVIAFFMLYATMVVYGAAICGMACQEWDGCT